jgi:hypothetical protein
MLDRSEQLAEAVEKYSQYVTPKVIARFGDNRFLKNVSVQSSNQYYEDAILGHKPDVYLAFDETGTFSAESTDPTPAIVADSSGKGNSAEVVGIDSTFTATLDSPYTSTFERLTSPVNDDFDRASLTLDISSEQTIVFNEELMAKNSNMPYLFNYNRNRWFIVNSRKNNLFTFDVPSQTIANYITLTNDISKKLDYALFETGGQDGFLETSLGVVIFKLGASDSAINPRNSQGAMLRFIDEDNYILVLYKTSSVHYFEIEEKINGIKYTTNTSNIAAWGVNDILKLEFTHNVLKFFKNGTLFFTHKLERKDNPAYASKHGLASRNPTITDTTQGVFVPNPTGVAWSQLNINTYVAKNYSLKVNSGLVRISNAKLSGSEDISIGLAFKPTSVSGNKGILKIVQAFPGSSAEAMVARLRLESGALKSTVWGYPDEDTPGSEYNLSYTPTSPFVANTWYNIVITINGNKIKMFVDGVLVDEVNDYSDTLLIPSINKISIFEDGDYLSNGSVDDFFIIPAGLTDDEVTRLYALSLNTEPFEDGRDIFSGDQAFNAVEEETFPYAFFHAKNRINKFLTMNGEYHLIKNRLAGANTCFFASRQSSNLEAEISGGYAFEDNPYIYAKFDPAKVTRFMISTGYELGKVKNFTLQYHKTEDPAGQMTTADITSFAGDSVVSIDLEEVLTIDQVRLTIVSTEHSDCPAIINQINVYYEADISDDVIQFDFSKIRDNYEATLPIGSTAANNGSINLNNTHQKYNLDNALSPYFGYVLPEVKISVALVYKIDEDTYEEVPLGESLFVERWSLSSDSMAVDISFSDWSVILQDLTAKNGFVFEDVVAGRAARDVVRESGLPGRKISYYENYNRVILKDQPAAYYRLGDIEPTVIADEFGQADASVAPSSQGITLGSSPILPQDKDFEIQNDARTLSALYQITANNVGLEGPKIRTANYAIRTQTAGLEATNYPVIQSEVDSIFDAAGDFTVEMLVSPAFIADGEERGILSKSNASSTNYYVYATRDGQDCSIKAEVKTTTATYTCQHVFDIDNFIDNLFHIVFTKENNQIKLYVNNQVQHLSILGNITLASDSPLRIFRKNLDESSLSFDGSISHVAFYSRLLTEEEIETHYISSTLSRLYVFPYLYFFDATYWDGMLTFATADVGMFNFDEFSNFNYDFKNAFHESAISKHNEVQHVFDSSKNIKQVQYSVDIQANKLKIKVNPKSKVAANVNSLWRAESGESLAITSITQDIGPNDTEILVANTENPIWPRSGFLKINNEIIRYQNREVNKFKELQRGYLETAASSHKANDLCRECRVYEFEFTEKPAISVRYPFVAAQIYEQRVDIDKFETTPFGGTVVVSASNNEKNTSGSNTTDEKNLVFLEGTNPLSGVSYFFSIAGIPLAEKVSEEKVEDEVRNIASSYMTMRPKEMTVDNKFIQTSAYARDVADFILTYFGNPVPIIDVDSIGVPFLQVGDLVQIDNMPDLHISDKLFWIIETSITYDGGVDQSFKMRTKNVF